MWGSGRAATGQGQYGVAGACARVSGACGVRVTELRGRCAWVHRGCEWCGLGRKAKAEAKEVCDRGKKMEMRLSKYSHIDDWRQPL